MAVTEFKIQSFFATFWDKNEQVDQFCRRVPRDPAGSDVMTVRPARGGMEEQWSRR